MATLTWQPPGAMRKRIVIQSPIDTSDGAGGAMTVWAPLYSAYASVEPLSGRDRAEMMAAQSDISHTVTMRFRPGVSAKCRVLLGARVFRVIVARDIEERHRQLVLDCAEVLGDAGS